MSDPLPDPIPAATLILMRARRSGAPELLMIERSPDMVFAAGAPAFPGGRIGPADRAAAARLPGADAAARIAALRETVEETGLGGELSPDMLTPFARWCPNFRETRRFDTLFFVAEAAADWPEPVAREAEAVRAFWASATETLAEIAAGRAHAIFPTRRTLERLAGFASIEEARVDAARHGLRKITPWIEERGGEKFLCIPEDAGYPVTAEPLATARRA